MGKKLIVVSNASKLINNLEIQSFPTVVYMSRNLIVQKIINAMDYIMSENPDRSVEDGFKILSKQN